MEGYLGWVGQEIRSVQRNDIVDVSNDACPILSAQRLCDPMCRDNLSHLRLQRGICHCSGRMSMVDSTPVITLTSTQLAPSYES